MTQYKLVPVEPTEEQWGYLARHIMMWLDLYPGSKTPRTLLEHLGRLNEPIPQWLLDEPEMKNLDHSMSKGTRCVILYKAMLAAAPEVNPWVSVKERLPAQTDVWLLCADKDGFISETRYVMDFHYWWDEKIMPIPRPEK